MPNLIVNKNNQGTVTIPRELLETLRWKKGDRLLVSKAPGQDHIIIENVSREEKR